MALFHHLQRIWTTSESDRQESRCDLHFDIELKHNHDGHPKFQSFQFPNIDQYHELGEQHSPLFPVHYNFLGVLHWKYFAGESFV